MWRCLCERWTTCGDKLHTHEASDFKAPFVDFFLAKISKILSLPMATFFCFCCLTWLQKFLCIQSWKLQENEKENICICCVLFIFRVCWKTAYNLGVLSYQWKSMKPRRRVTTPIFVKCSIQMIWGKPHLCTKWSINSCVSILFFSSIH